MTTSSSASVKTTIPALTTAHVKTTATTTPDTVTAVPALTAVGRT